VLPHRSTPLIASAVLLAVVTLAYGEEHPQPIEVGGGWMTCPRGWIITHVGICVAEHQGPVVEYGCTVRENGYGEVIGQTCPSQQMVWVGNVGDFGEPVVSVVGPGPAFVGPIIGISVVSGGHRR
jgi:hypothetical protein